MVMQGGLHDVCYNSDEVFRRAVARGAGVETYIRAARPAGFNRVVWAGSTAPPPKTLETSSATPASFVQCYSPDVVSLTYLAQDGLIRAIY